MQNDLNVRKAQSSTAEEAEAGVKVRVHTISSSQGSIAHSLSFSWFLAPKTLPPLSRRPSPTRRWVVQARRAQNRSAGRKTTTRASGLNASAKCPPVSPTSDEP